MVLLTDKLGYQRPTFFMKIIHICFVTMTIYCLELVVNKTREKKQH